MFNRNNTPAPAPVNTPKRRPDSIQAIHTLLGKDTTWKGEIHSGPNSLRIEGKVEGTIHSEGEVTIAPSGYMKGTIHAKHLIVTGKVEGIFKIAECLEIHGTGWVEGDVEVGSLVVDEGGTLLGTCTRRSVEKAKEKEKEKVPEKEAPKTSNLHDRPPISSLNGTSTVPVGADHGHMKL